MNDDDLSPIHPGEILLEEFLKPSATSAAQLAKKMDVPVAAIELLVQGRGRVTTELAAALSEACKTSPDFWLNLQRAYEDQLANWRQRSVSQ